MRCLANWRLHIRQTGLAIQITPVLSTIECYLQLSDFYFAFNPYLHTIKNKKTKQVCLKKHLHTTVEDLKAPQKIKDNDRHSKIKRSDEAFWKSSV